MVKVARTELNRLRAHFSPGGVRKSAELVSLLSDACLQAATHAWRSRVESQAVLIDTYLRAEEGNPPLLACGPLPGNPFRASFSPCDFFRIECQDSEGTVVFGHKRTVGIQEEILYPQPLSSQAQPRDSAPHQEQRRQQARAAAVMLLQQSGYRVNVEGDPLSPYPAHLSSKQTPLAFILRIPVNDQAEAPREPLS